MYDLELKILLFFKKNQNTILNVKQAEAEVVPSSSLVEVEVEMGIKANLNSSCS